MGNTHPFTLTESAASSPSAAEPAAAAFCRSGLDRSFWQPHSLLRSFVPVRHIPYVSLERLKGWIRAAPFSHWLTDWLTQSRSASTQTRSLSLSLSTHARLHPSEGRRSREGGTDRRATPQIPLLSAHFHWSRAAAKYAHRMGSRLAFRISTSSSNPPKATHQRHVHTPNPSSRHRPLTPLTLSAVCTEACLCCSGEETLNVCWIKVFFLQWQKLLFLAGIYKPTPMKIAFWTCSSHDGGHIYRKFRFKPCLLVFLYSNWYESGLAKACCYIETTNAGSRAPCSPFLLLVWGAVS